MTKISSIYDHLTNLVGTAVPDLFRIPNPYFIDENTQLYLSRGYGIGVGGGSGQALDFCHRAWDRIFTIVLVRQITTTDHNVESRADIEKVILEEHFAVLNAIESDTNFDGNTTTVEVVGDSGLQYLTQDRFKYLSISIDVRVLYQERYNQ